MHMHSATARQQVACGGTLRAAPCLPSRISPRPRVAPGAQHQPTNVCSPLTGLRTAQRPDRRRVVAVRAAQQVANGMATSGQKQGSASQATPVNVNCRIYSEEGVNTSLELQLSFVGKDLSQVGLPVDLSGFKAVPWMGKDPLGNSDQPVKRGIVYEGEVDIPEDAVNNIVYMRMKPKAKVDMEYINKVEITSDRDGDGGGIRIAPNSWIHKAQGGRFFFAKGQAHLPYDTPPELVALRAAELDEVKGSLVQQLNTRSEWDRIYDYDVYNDLAGYKDNRPVLGGSKEYPYPRRLRTGRAKVRGPDGKPTFETRDTPTGRFWIPLDEKFNTIKNTNFHTYTLLAIIPTVVEIVKTKLNWGDQKLNSFKDVDDIYAEIGKPDFTFGVKEFIAALVTGAGRLGSNAMKRFGINPDDLPALDLPFLGAISLGAVGSSIDNIKKLVGGAQQLVDLPPPLVAKGRPGVWDTDEEWGRQALAGAHPSGIVAVSSAAQLGSITEAHLKPHLQGNSLSSLIATGTTEPRLLVIDHTAIFEDYAQRITALGGRYGYSGRCIVYQRDDKQWVPVGIELTSSEKKTTIYTPSDHPNVWRMAKGVIGTLDGGFHQLISHWLRCHACTEPYIIATHRCLSSLHPVYKLMIPHFRFTTSINADARLFLICANGIVEKTFTPGPYSFEMSSKVYGALWRFDTQGLPGDLVSRGLAKRGSDGKVKRLLKDYPYADDGMLIWDTVHEWVGKYLRCYYNDSVPEKSVAQDSEINAWWNEIQTKGHPDIKEGWPEMKCIDDLTDILTTMIWVSSAHHAAINFCQYGLEGYMLNRSPICLKPIPAKDTPEYRELIKSPASGEKAYCKTFIELNTMLSVFTMELLSTHADNEYYLGDPNHSHILEEEPAKLYQEFSQKMKKVEATIEARNKDPKLKTRNGGNAIPYEFLLPTSGPGITNRGVPQSVSI